MPAGVRSDRNYSSVIITRTGPWISHNSRRFSRWQNRLVFRARGKPCSSRSRRCALLEYAEKLLALRNESLRAVADRANTPRGTLLIGASEATCLYVLPEVFAEYHRLYADVQINIYRNFSHKVLEKVEDGSVDVGIVTLPIKSPSLKTHSIFQDRLLLMVSPKNALAKKKVVRVSEIVEQPLIYPKTGSTRQMLDKLFRPYRSQLHITMELASVGMIKAFVAANLGVSLISETFARDEVRAGEVKLIPIADTDLWRELGLVYRRDRTLPRAAAAFVSLISRRAGTKLGGHVRER